MKIENIEKINNLINGYPTITMYRASFGSKRAYVFNDGSFRIYSGITSALESSKFKGDIGAKRLDKWRMTMVRELGSQEKQEAYLNSTADFGTLCHECIVRIKENGCLDWNYETDYATEFFTASARNNGMIPNGEIIRKQVFEYQKTAASIMQFIFDNVVEIHSVEGMCFSDELGIATPTDIVCTVKGKKGDIRVSLNLKTSGQFSDEQREQVVLERYLWNTTYPDFQVVKTGLLRSKDWSTKKMIPTYEYELIDEEYEATTIKKILSRLKLCKEDPNATYLNFPQGINVFTGITKLGEQPVLAYKTIQELWDNELKK